jgi:tRNA(Ile)-lysidine synthetase-like protein
MVEKLKNHCNQHFPFLKQKKVLLAVSGGLDSMVLVYLFQQLHYEIGVAHCNFQLRGLESFEDQNFIQNYAEANSLPIFITQFDTQAFAQDYKLSIQVAARELRYNWFYELLETQNFDYVLTAHHADDNLETFLINLSRGTGLDGLTGIPEQNDKVIRPLLAFSRQEMEAYAKQNAIQWREDSSNASDKYLRNKIRHDVVPILKELNTDFIASFQKTQEYLQQAQVMVEDASIMVYQQVAKEVGEEIHFDLKKLKPLPNYKSYLYQWLREFGFSAWDDVYDLVDSQSGKQIFSSHFRLLKNRDYLVLCPLDFTDSKREYFITKNQKEVKVPLNLSICKVTDISDTTIESIFVDEMKLEFPLVLRRWKEADSFQPFGYERKVKKSE